MSALRVSVRIAASLLIAWSLVTAQIPASEAEPAWQQELLPDAPRRSGETTVAWIQSLLPTVFLLPPECWNEVLRTLEPLGDLQEDTLTPWESLDFCFAEEGRSLLHNPRLLAVQRVSRTADEARLVDAVLRFELVTLPQLALFRESSFAVIDDSVSLTTMIEAQKPETIQDDYEPTLDLLPSLDGWKTSTAILAIVLLFLGAYVMLAWMTKG